MDAASNLGWYYDQGIGTRADSKLACRWYRVGHRHGDVCGTTNMGVLWRDRGEYRRALIWLGKAVRAGNHGANLDIAKIHLTRGQPQKAVPHLEAVLRADVVTEDTREQSERLLRRIRVSPQRGIGNASVQARGKSVR